MIQIKKTGYKSLRKLSIGERIKAINNPNVGQFLFSSLTPTQYADLFPRYYRDSLPDVGLLAVPSSASSMRQAAVSDQRVQQAVEGSDTGILGKIKQKLGLGKTALISKPGITAPPQLSPEDLMTYNAIKNQPLPADDPRTKFLSGLSEDQLKAGGLQKYKDEQTGKEMFKYVAPTVTEDEAKRIFTSQKSSDTMALELIRRREGFLDTPRFDVNHLRAGYGSDTITLPDGTVKEVRAGDRVSREDAERDLLRRMPQFQKQGIIKYVGQGAWDKLNPGAQAALTSLAYNYGSIEKLTSLQQAIRSGDHNAIADTVSRYSSHNNGVNYTRRMEEASMIRNSTPSIGVGGQPTPEQLTSIIERRKAELAKGQIQSLANVAGSTMGATGAPGTSARTSTATFTGDSTPVVIPDNTRGYCGVGTRHAAGQMFGDKFFNNGLSVGGVGSNAASLSGGNKYFQQSGYYKGGQGLSQDQLHDQKYLDSLPIGSIISAAGGNGNGHVQIKVGPNKWMSDFDQGNRVLLTRGKDGPAYTNFTVHEPNEKGVKILNERGFKQDVSPAQTEQVISAATSAINSSPEDSQVPVVAPELPKAKVDIKQTGTPDFMQTPGASPVQQPVPTEPGTPAPQAAPEPAQKKAEAPKTQPVKYNVNQAKLIAAIKNTDEFKNTFGSSFATDSMILEGFANDSRVKGAGVTYDPASGTMHIKDPNDPRVKKAMEGLDTKKFMTPIEEKKKEEPKKPEVPPEVKPQSQQTQAPPAPTTPAPAPATVTAAPEAPSPTPQTAPTPEPPKPGEPAKAKVEIKPAPVEHQATPAPTAQAAPATPQTPPPAPPKQEPPKVPSKAEGGGVKVKGEVAAYPINGLRGDNSLVIDTKTQQPLFTMNPSREAMVPTPENNRANIVPTDKVNPQDVARPPVSATDQITKDLQALRQEVGSAFEKLTTGEPENKASPKGAPQHRDPDMIGTLLERTKVPYSNPTAMRAFSRARFNETGDATSDFHHSTGNSNTV